MKYPKNSYAAREMHRRRIEARFRLKRMILNIVSGIALVAFAEAFFFALFLL